MEKVVRPVFLFFKKPMWSRLTEGANQDELDLDTLVHTKVIVTGLKENGYTTTVSSCFF